MNKLLYEEASKRHDIFTGWNEVNHPESITTRRYYEKAPNRQLTVNRHGT
jgi:hypothetical protein